MGHNPVGVFEVGGLFAGGLDVLHEHGRVEPVGGGDLLQARDLGNDDGVGVVEGLGQFQLKDVAAGGVGAGLEHGPELLGGVFVAERAEGLADGGGMMAEIVDQGHAPGDGAHFHAAAHAGEGRKGRLDLAVFEAVVLGHADDGQGVAHIELAHQVEVELEARDLKLRGGGAVSEVEPLDGVVGPQAEALDGAVGHAQERGDVGVVAVAQEQTAAGHQIDQALEGQLDGGQVVEDVGVVELDVVDDDRFGEVMEELAAFVEERGVVFVALDDEPFAVGEPGALAEVVGHAADHVAGVEAVVLEDPGQQGGGGGLAVGAAHDDGAFAADEILLQEFGQRAVSQPVLQHRLDLRVAPGEGVADDDQVGPLVQVALRIPGGDLNLARGKKRRHGRVEVLVRTGDQESLLLHRGGGGCHGGAANASKMDMLDLGEHRAQSLLGPPRSASRNVAVKTSSCPGAPVRIDSGPYLWRRSQHEHDDRRP